MNVYVFIYVYTKEMFQSFQRNGRTFGEKGTFKDYDCSLQILWISV